MANTVVSRTAPKQTNGVILASGARLVPFDPMRGIAIEGRFAPCNLNALPHPFHFGGQLLQVTQKMNHNTALYSVGSLALCAIGNADDVIRDATDSCNTADIDFGSVTVIDGGGNHLNHSFP
jgi:hypothetical protein